MFTIVAKVFNIHPRWIIKYLIYFPGVPLAMEAALHEGVLETLIRNNELLEQIMKCLESYLDRVAK